MNSQPTLVIFLSAVSSEFHQSDPGQPQPFRSYRGILAEAFRRAGPQFQVIVQEELAQSSGDLLQTLDNEVAQSKLIIHLVGDAAGALPEAAPIRRLRERHPEFLSHEPELREVLGDFSALSFTQWEMYLAFHHKLDRMIFVAEENAPRSPAFKSDPEQKRSQQAHLGRLKKTGVQRERFENQHDLALKAITSVIRHGLAPLPQQSKPSPQAVAAARDDAPAIVSEMAASITKPDPKIPVPDSAGVAVYVHALDQAAAKRGLDRSSTLALLDQHQAELTAAAEANPSVANLRDLAFANCAIANYPEARRHARRCADMALERLRTDPRQSEAHRENALNALLLLSEIAKAARDVPAAIAALEEGSSLLDRNEDPLYWASYHRVLAEHYLDQYRLDKAELLVNEIVDIHEEKLSAEDPQLARTLILWTGLLDKTGDYSGMESVAGRAAAIFHAQMPPDLSGLAMAFCRQANALQALGQFADAEFLLRQELAIEESLFGPDHPETAVTLDNLAQPLLLMNRPEEAESLLRRAIAITEKSLGATHPNFAVSLGHLGRLLLETNRLREAEPVLRQALGIKEQNLGPNHHAVGAELYNLGRLLRATNRLEEAEQSMRRTIAILEKSVRTNHPFVATVLGDLAALLLDTGRFEEAEPLMRRALAIDEYHFDPNHPNIARDLANLGSLLRATDRLKEAEPLMRRTIAIVEKTLGPRHPHYATSIGHLAGLLQNTNRLEEAEPLLRQALAIDERNFGPDHPDVGKDLNNLAWFLRRTNRLEEAEPLLRRVIIILRNFGESNGYDHPYVRSIVHNYRELLEAMKLPADEIQRRIQEAAGKYSALE